MITYLYLWLLICLFLCFSYFHFSFLLFIAFVYNYFIYKTCGVFLQISHLHYTIPRELFNSCNTYYMSGVAREIKKNSELKRIIFIFFIRKYTNIDIWKAQNCFYNKHQNGWTNRAQTFWSISHDPGKDYEWLKLKSFAWNFFFKSPNLFLLEPENDE